MRPRAIPEGANCQGSAFDLYARSSEYARQMNGKTIPADLTTQVDDGQDFACTMLDVFTNERQIDAVVARTSHL